ncbi:MAG: kelch repeat-containing protein [Xanthobacteraceae bacterium]|uniref:Kelch repeat-containing protein n=1 Tax=Pseudolabrys sp. TaxID=1960880 RepID=UPI003D0F299C
MTGRPFPLPLHLFAAVLVAAASLPLGAPLRAQPAQADKPAQATPSKAPNPAEAQKPPEATKPAEAPKPAEAQKPETPAPGKAAEKPLDEKTPAEKPTADKPWVTLAPLPQPATDLAGVAVNGKLYLFGGLDGIRPSGLAFEYDAATDSWTKKKPMPVNLHRFAVAAYGDRIYLFGGFKYPDNGANAWQPVDTAWRYDPASDEWTALAPMPGGKRGAASAAVVDGKIFVIGGATTQPDTKDTAIEAKRRHAIVGAVEEYDPKANSWRVRTALPTPRAQAAVAVVAGKIYVIGGRIASAFAEDASDTDVVEGYDPARDLWSRPLAKMPAPRSAMGVASWRNRIVIAGGETTDARGTVSASDAVASYEPETNAWRALATLPAARRGIATGLIGDRLYVAGGAAMPLAAPAAGDSTKKIEAPAGRATLETLQLDVLR